MNKMSFDPFLMASRPDQVSIDMRNRVSARGLVDGLLRRVKATSAPLWRTPDTDGTWRSQALRGEAVTVYEEEAGWSWVQMSHDDCVGFLTTSDLGRWVEPTHRVASSRAHVYESANIKRPAVATLSLGALVTIAREEGDFLVTDENTYIFRRHLAPVGAIESDFVAVAERFLDTPYVPAGRSWEGMDSAGLVQTALGAAGVKAPRDCDVMEAVLGVLLPHDVAPCRGDLVFWSGHVGIVRDDANIIHADAGGMCVVSEPLADARSRLRAAGDGEIRSIKRLGMWPNSMIGQQT